MTNSMKNKNPARHDYSYDLRNTHLYLCVYDLQMLGVLPITCL